MIKQEQTEYSYCTIGALRQARLEGKRTRHIQAAAEMLIGKNLGLGVENDLNSIPQWNDSRDSGETVIDALTQVAKDLRNQ